MELPDPIIEDHEGFLVVRDDMIAGGTKRRILGGLLKNTEAREFVYPSTAYGYGPLAVAHVAADLGRKARLYYAHRNPENWTGLMCDAAALGAEIVPVPMGYMSVVESRARTYCAQNPDAMLLPLGFDTDDFRAQLTGLAKSLKIKPKEVWCAAGTGALTRSLQAAWPDATHHAVVVASKAADTGYAERHLVDVSFNRAARHLPPFPSASNYDAKAWNIMKHHARPGALFWNVGA